jgi:hypothetical protein
MHPLLLGMIWTFAAGGKLFAYQSGVLIVGYSLRLFRRTRSGAHGSMSYRGRVRSTGIPGSVLLAVDRAAMRVPPAWKQMRVPLAWKLLSIAVCLLWVPLFCSSRSANGVPHGNMNLQ